MMNKFAQLSNNRSGRLKTLAALILLLCAALLYIVTLDNGLMPRELEGGDLITHQYAQVQARPSNAPGYPIYTVGGWLWFHAIRSILHTMGLSLPNPIPILSSYSTFWALLSLWLFYQILCHVTGVPDRPNGNWVVAWLLSAFYAVTFFFWFYATTTEQYSSAIAHTLAIVYGYLIWRENKNAKLLLFLSFLCGLSLAHMLTVAFIVPPLILLVLWDAPWLLRRPLTILGTVAAAALPLSSYLYVYVRGVAHPEWWGNGNWATGQEWFWSFVRTSQGWEELGWGLKADRAFWGGGFPELMWQELTIPLFIIGLIGIAFLGRRMVILLYGTLVIYLLFCWAYRYGNWFQVILPAYPLMLMGVAVLADRWWHWLPTTESEVENPSSPMGLRWRRGVLVFAFGLLIIWRGMSSLPEANSTNRSDDGALDDAMILLDAPLPTGVTLFGTVGETLAIQYLTQIWGVRSDLQTVTSPRAAEILGGGDTVYATTQSVERLYSEMPEELEVLAVSVNPDWVLLSAGAEAQGSTQSEEAVADYLEPTIVLDGKNTWNVSLVGYAVTSSPAGIPRLARHLPGLDVMLYWLLADGSWPNGVSISVRPMRDGALIPDLAGEAGAIVQQDASLPMHGLLSLQVGADSASGQGLIADAYRLRLPLETVADVNEIQILLYRVVDDGFETVGEYRLDVLP